MPYCWDGHDNAARAAETGVGRRLDRYSWSDADLKAAIEGLLGDHRMHARLKANAAGMHKAAGVTRAAEEIVRVMADTST